MTEEEQLLERARESLIAARLKELDPKFHRYLIASQDTRQVGDYGVEKNVTLDEAEQVIERAQEFLMVAESYLSRNRA